jgi:hypothetical protein
MPPRLSFPQREDQAAGDIRHTHDRLGAAQQIATARERRLGGIGRELVDPRRSPAGHVPDLEPRRRGALAGEPPSNGGPGEDPGQDRVDLEIEIPWSFRDFRMFETSRS